MPYKMNEKQFDAVLALSSADRSSHFVSKVADWQQLWGVRNDDGWLVPILEEDLEYFPVWPHPEYAQHIANEHFPGHIATEIELDDFLNEWLPKLNDDNIKIGVFPNRDWSIWVMEPKELAECLEDELSQYQ